MGKLLDIAASVEKSPVTRVLLGIVLGVSSVLIDKKMNNREAKPFMNTMIVVKGSNGMEYDIKPGAQLAGAQLAEVDLIRADLRKAILQGANLRGANLTVANLTGANLTGADLTGANLNGASLTGIVSGKITGVPKVLPKGYKLINGYIIGPNVNLTSADLTGVNLRGVNLRGANLTSAILTGANLTGANLTGTNLTGIVSGQIKGVPTLPTGYKLIDGYIKLDQM